MHKHLYTIVYCINGCVSNAPYARTCQRQHSARHAQHDDDGRRSWRWTRIIYDLWHFRWRTQCASTNTEGFSLESGRDQNVVVSRSPRRKCGMPPSRTSRWHSTLLLMINVTAARGEIDRLTQRTRARSRHVKRALKRKKRTSRRLKRIIGHWIQTLAHKAQQGQPFSLAYHRSCGPISTPIGF